MVLRERTNLQLWAILSICAMAVPLRCYRIGDPYIRIREADDASIAHHFFTEGYKLLWPQVDWVGDEPGYVETELQLLPFTAALLYRVFGETPLVGRGLVILTSLGAIWFVWRLGRLYFGEPGALYAALFFAAAPLSIVWGQMFMPDMPMVFLSLAGVYYYDLWTRHSRWLHWALAAVLLSLAVLVKLPAAHVLLVVAYLAWRRRGWGMLSDPASYGLLAAIAVPAFLYYYHAHQIAADHLTFGIWSSGFNKWVGAARLTMSALSMFVARAVVEYIGAPGLVLALVGAVHFWRQQSQMPIYVWLLAFCILFVGVLQGHITHPYYQLPLVPVLAWFAGGALSEVSRHLNNRRAVVVVVLSAAVVLGVWGAKGRFDTYAPREANSLKARAAVRQLVPPDARIIVHPESVRNLHLFNRRGWNARSEKHTLQAPDPVEPYTPEYFARRIAEGADYFITVLPEDMTRETRAYLENRHKLLLSREAYEIYRLSAEAERPRSQVGMPGARDPARP